MDILLNYLPLAFSGFLVGFIVGMTGVGGGSLMTPILVLVFSVKPVVAVGTDLLYAAITKSGGIFFHQKRKNIEWDIVFLLCIGSIPASLLAIFILKYLIAKGINYEPIITITLSISLILTSLGIFLKPYIQKIATKNFLNINLLLQRYRTPLTIIAGVLISILVTLSSVGAGVIGTAILFILYPHLKTTKIIGTDLAHAIPITLIAGLGHWHLDTVDFTLLISLIIGSLPGVFLGSYMSTMIPDKIIRLILACMLFLIGIKIYFN